MLDRTKCAGVLALLLVGCQSSPDKDLQTTAARCAVPISSIYLVRAGNSTTVRENVNDGGWSTGGRACIRQWAASKGYTYFDAASDTHGHE